MTNDVTYRIKHRKDYSKPIGFRDRFLIEKKVCWFYFTWWAFVKECSAIDDAFRWLHAVDALTEEQGINEIIKTAQPTELNLSHFSCSGRIKF